MTDEGERIRALEVRQEVAEAKIERLIELEMTFAKWAAAQEVRNALQREQHQEAYEDRWQVWLRWAVTPGLPLVAMLLWAWQAISGGEP